MTSLTLAASALPPSLPHGPPHHGVSSHYGPSPSLPPKTTQQLLSTSGTNASLSASLQLRTTQQPKCTCGPTAPRQHIFEMSPKQLMSTSRPSVHRELKASRLFCAQSTSGVRRTTPGALGPRSGATASGSLLPTAAQQRQCSQQLIARKPLCAQSSPHPTAFLHPTPKQQPQNSHHLKRVLSRRLLLPLPVVTQASQQPPLLHLETAPHARDEASQEPSQTKRDGAEGETGGSRGLTRRTALLCATATATWQVYGGLVDATSAEARERRQKTNFPEEDYADAGNGLRYLDIETGKGKSPEIGEQVKVHFEVKYGPLTVVSTRESKLLGGNRSISQPYLFVLGAAPYSERRKDPASENANGLFSAQAAPKPPKALYSAVEGMRIGGKRTVLVPAELAYGKKGYNEVPPGAPVQLIIDLLDVTIVE